MSYTITQRHIPGLPQNPYRNGVGAYEGFVFHCTDNPSRPDNPSNEANYMAQHWQDAFTHYIVGVENGQAVIYELADPNYICWGCGHEGNQRFVQAELCMTDDPAEFKLMYDAWVWLGAKVLHDKKLGVSPAPGTAWAHVDVTRLLGGTDHQDPIAYLQKFNITWTQHVANVLAVYKEMEAYKMTAEDANKLIQILGAMYGITIRDEDKMEIHRLANELRKASNQPTT